VADEDTARSFHERFDIEVGVPEAKRRFMNRVTNIVFYHLIGNNLSFAARQDLLLVAASALGEEFVLKKDLKAYAGGDFFRYLRVLEAIYEMHEGSKLGEGLSDAIANIISESETDLGIRWQPPAFVRAGAKVLDENLVNEPLQWLSNPKYESVIQPFRKGLRDYLTAGREQDRLSDVVTDMYESLEAMARVVIGNDRELSRNQEVFIKQIEVSKAYKQLLRSLLREYVDYGGKYRHAALQGNPKSPPSEPEAESVVYLTGLFIRLAIRQTQPST
jgi:hypothetical protein